MSNILNFYPSIKEFEYFTILINPVAEGKKTPVYKVMSKSASKLAEIMYFPSWRKFVLCPSPMTVWNTGCLENIIEFLKSIDECHKKELAYRKQIKEKI